MKGKLTIQVDVFTWNYSQVISIRRAEHGYSILIGVYVFSLVDSDYLAVSDYSAVFHYPNGLGTGLSLLFCRCLTST